MNGGVTARGIVRQSPLNNSLDLLQRAVALSCLLEGMAYWVRILGFFEGPEWRFDLMPFYWQATAAPLAVLFPFAAVGLWALASWGPVIWFVCAAAEMVMYGGLPEIYGNNPWLLFWHGTVAGTYAALRTLIFVSHRRAAN